MWNKEVSSKIWAYGREPDKRYEDSLLEEILLETDEIYHNEIKLMFNILVLYHKNSALYKNSWNNGLRPTSR